MKNQTQVQELSRDASPELDALIDEKVFGYAWLPVTTDDIAPPTCTHRLYRHAVTLGHIRAERHADGHVVVFGGRDYSHTIADAWLVVERMGDRGFHASVQSPFEPGEDYFAGFTPHGTSGWNGSPDFRAGARTAALAICRAALRALTPAHV